MDARRGRQRGRAARAAPERGGIAPLDGTPSAFEAVTRQMVDTVSDELREIRHRLDNLLWMVIGAILLDTGLRVMGT